VSQEVFWRRKTLREMTPAEWESLCDGCALCCLHKVEDEDTQEVFYTTVVCHLLDLDNCHCTEYQRRCQLVPSCIKLAPEDVEAFEWLPPTCAYRLVHEGKDLPEWHPLVSGDRESVIRANASVLSYYEVRDNEIHEEELINFIVDDS
jgi:uncharacterized cysteine cluster protein YcgN (CxxCxxCC family)